MRYIAFLRGINAGLRLKMTDLRLLFEELGFTNVTTVLATGNVIFETSQSDRKGIARRIEQAIERQYAYSSVVVLYTLPELDQLIKAEPFKGVSTTTKQSPQVSFTQEDAGTLPFTLPFSVPKKGYVILRMVGNAVCSVLDISGATHTNYLTVMDRSFNKQVTTRNWNTVERCYRVMGT